MLNRACLLGNVGADPEAGTAGTGNSYASFSLATTERWKDKDSGEKKERTEWHRVVAWGPLAETVTKYVKKGSKLYIEGSIRTHKYQKEGQDHWSTQVVLQGFDARLILLDKREGGDRRDASVGDEPEDRSGGKARVNEPLDQEIPF